MHAPHSMSKWSASFRLKRSKVVTRHKKPPKSGVMFTRRQQHWQINRDRRRLKTRHTLSLLLAPEMLAARQLDRLLQIMSALAVYGLSIYLNFGA